MDILTFERSHGTGFSAVGRTRLFSLCQIRLPFTDSIFRLLQGMVDGVDVGSRGGFKCKRELGFPDFRLAESPGVSDN